MNFTAEQVREMAVNVRDCAWDAETKEYMVLIEPMLTAYADAIDAHIAGMGEPVATICDGWDLRFVGSAPIAEVVRKHGLKIGDTLYIAPPIDVATVRGVIAELRDYGDYADRIKLGEATDKLEAAIKRAARKSHG